jgi:hypothetical protein
MLELFPSSRTMQPAQREARVLIGRTERLPVL